MSNSGQKVQNAYHSECSCRSSVASLLTVRTRFCGSDIDAPLEAFVPLLSRFAPCDAHSLLVHSGHEVCDTKGGAVDSFPSETLNDNFEAPFVEEHTICGMD